VIRTKGRLPTFPGWRPRRNSRWNGRRELNLDWGIPLSCIIESVYFGGGDLLDISLFAWIVYFLWLLSEIAIVITTKRQRKNVVVEKKDKGSFWFIIFGVFICVFLIFQCHYAKWGYVDTSISNIGAILVIVGVCIRVWAVSALGKHFSMMVSVASQQKIIQHGPYRVIRHPSYTGALVTFIGLGLAFNTWIGSLIMFVFFVIVYGYRIRIEEKALIERFPDEYPSYVQNTWRLIPFIW
jgi:protein-S-isoprenylcysteine O-methyltransferase Ste14